jgi:hypothetical protein
LYVFRLSVNVHISFVQGVVNAPGMKARTTGPFWTAWLRVHGVPSLVFSVKSGAISPTRGLWPVVVAVVVVMAIGRRAEPPFKAFRPVGPLYVQVRASVLTRMGIARGPVQPWRSRS